MKKVTLLLMFFMLAVCAESFSQTAPAGDFYAGKWEIMVSGTPNGDARFVTDLTRKDGKLTGELSNPTDASADKIPITQIEEPDGKLVIYFSTQGYDVNIDLAKVDDDNLQGSLMNMFDAKAKRIK